jgi:uncharacterized protein (TIGR00296 family)
MDLSEGRTAVELARKAAENFVNEIKSSKPEDLPEIFYENRGAFVTYHTYPDRKLRGCIGYPEPIMPLYKALMECAVHACQDPRFPPVQKSELSRIIVEVSILTKPWLIECPPEDYPRHVKIGKDGLIVKKGFHRGLLLPQVGEELKLTAKDFLRHTCLKAGLMPDFWLEGDCKIYKFQAQVFGEDTPGGNIERVET